MDLIFNPIKYIWFHLYPNYEIWFFHKVDWNIMDNGALLYKEYAYYELWYSKRLDKYKKKEYGYKCKAHSYYNNTFMPHWKNHIFKYNLRINTDEEKINYNKELEKAINNEQYEKATHLRELIKLENQNERSS